MVRNSRNSQASVARLHDCFTQYVSKLREHSHWHTGRWSAMTVSLIFGLGSFGVTDLWFTADAIKFWHDMGKDKILFFEDI